MQSWKHPDWDKDKDAYDRKQEHAKKDHCPECGEPWAKPPSLAPCHCPTMIVIPPGKHIHVDCPQHGKFIMKGPPHVTC